MMMVSLFFIVLDNKQWIWREKDSRCDKGCRGWQTRDICWEHEADIIADDEENLRKHAARGAQAAITAARDKARAFDESMPGAKKKEEEESMPIDREYRLIIRLRILHEPPRN